MIVTKKYKPAQSLLVKNPLIGKHWIWQSVDKLVFFLTFSSPFDVISFCFFEQFKMS